MKHYLKFDLEKWSANLDILSLQREHLSFPSLLSLILELELKAGLEQLDLKVGASSPGILIVLCDNIIRVFA